jgi:nucleoid DNA-binding protein
MEKIMKKPELIDELAERTGFYKKNMAEVVDALADIIEDQFKNATLKERSELHLAPGVVLVGTRKPAGEAKNPSNGETVISPEKVIPSAIFKQSIRQKLYKKSNYYKKKTKKG